MAGSTPVRRDDCGTECSAEDLGQTRGRSTRPGDAQTLGDAVWSWRWQPRPSPCQSRNSTESPSAAAPGPVADGSGPARAGARPAGHAVLQLLLEAGEKRHRRTPGRQTQGRLDSGAEELPTACQCGDLLLRQARGRDGPQRSPADGLLPEEEAGPGRRSRTRGWTGPGSSCPWAMCRTRASS